MFYRCTLTHQKADAFLFVKILRKMPKMILILSTLQLHSGIDCCLPLACAVCAVLRCSYVVYRLLYVCLAFRIFRFSCLLFACLACGNVWNLHRSRCATLCDISLLLFYCLGCTDCTEFFNLARARSNNFVVCSTDNFLSCSTAKDVAIASAISSLVAVYRFI